MWAEYMLANRMSRRRAGVLLPRKARSSSGLFAWGMAQPDTSRLLLIRAEFALLFFGLPLTAIIVDLRAYTPLVVLTMLGSTVALLSTTRNFHWGDLLPVDPLSEWRIVLAAVAICVAISSGLSFAIAPELFLDTPAGFTPMLIAFPLTTALPIELVHRALFFRRFGHLFPNEPVALAVGALSTGLAYMMLTGGLAGAGFGVVTGLILGRIYFRTGQFALCVVVHWIAAISFFVLGPGSLFV